MYFNDKEIVYVDNARKFIAEARSEKQAEKIVNALNSLELFDEMKEALDTLCNVYLANRGSEHEFVTCITPKGVPDYWKRATAILQKAENIKK